MRLQTESRRMSNMSIDLSRAQSSSKRTSFTPLTGSGATRMNAHRRISSVSDSTGFVYDGNNGGDPSSISPNAQIISLPADDLQSNGVAPTPRSAKRISGFFGGASSSSPPQIPMSSDPLASQAQLESLVRELAAARMALEETRHELTECQEAREASETCVKALRNFISENSTGEQGTGGLKLPPLPSDATADDAEVKKSASAGSGWGALKLWRTDTTKDGATTRSSASIASGGDSIISPTNEAPPQSFANPATSSSASIPLSKKIGGFFTSRASAASPPPQAPHSSQQEPILNGSDCSSVAEDEEPVSPSVEQGPGVGVRMHQSLPRRGSVASNAASLAVLDGKGPETLEGQVPVGFAS